MTLHAVCQAKAAVAECTHAEQRTQIQLKDRRIEELSASLSAQQQENAGHQAEKAKMSTALQQSQKSLAERTEQVTSLKSVLESYQT